ncbi:hypothetical protein BUME_08810 [[Butyribacterium] methylotrophicum]|nr:hypothetical protein BUME_08810 [[Butyribacterium] methylotrophicum]WPK82524.1 hypothetical protein EUCAMar_00410 [Eubacterium callanderi]
MLHEKVLNSGQDCRQLTLSAEDFPASHIVLSEAEKARTMNGICGQSSVGSSENLSPASSLEKMCRAYYQQYMTLYAPTWKTKVTKCGRSISRLTLSRPRMRDTGYLLLASPRASQDYKPIRKPTPTEANGKHGLALCASLGIIYPERIGQHINPRYLEWMMGFPMGWTDINSSA